MRYVEARVDDYFRDETYRIYVTRSLQLIPQNQYLATGYTDFLDPTYKSVDDRSGKEIVTDIILRAGLQFEEQQ